MRESSFPPVALAGAESYERGEIQAAVERLFSSLEEADSLPDFAGKKITVKPNLLMRRSPDEVTTTHPEVVVAVILSLQRRGAAGITIADSPGGPYSKALLSSIYRSTGMEKAALETGAALNLDTLWVSTPSPAGKLCHSFNIITPVDEADFVVSIGKLKTHCMTGLSGGVKNLFGCVPGLQKPELHYRFQKKEDFCSMLVDLAATVSPCITVMDGVESMEGDGPSAGTKRKTGLVCASASPFVLDLFLCSLLGFAVDELPTVAESKGRGLCPGEASAVSLINPEGLPTFIADYKKPRSKTVDFFGGLPSFLQRPMAFVGNRFLSPRPVVKKTACIGCGKCAETCPAKTIRLAQRKAYIDYNRCIKCYCCHELCPVKAISVKNPAFFRL